MREKYYVNRNLKKVYTENQMKLVCEVMTNGDPWEDNDMFTEWRLNNRYTSDYTCEHASKGLLKFAIKNKHYVVAARVYRELNNCSLVEAFSATNAMFDRKESDNAEE